MLIDCPHCSRSYHVDSGDLGRGRTVVCPRCDAQWFQPAETARTVTPALEVTGVNSRALVAMLDEAPAPRRRRLSLPGPVLSMAGVALACLALTALVVKREAVVRALPRTAPFYAAAHLPVNVVGLVFARVASERLASSDVTVRGSLRNLAGRRVVVPRLAFEVRDGSGAMLVTWSEKVPAPTLGAGRALDFRSTPHRLPADSRTVLVRFE